MRLLGAIDEFKNAKDQYKVISVCTSHIEDSDRLALNALTENSEHTMISSTIYGWRVKLYEELKLNLEYLGISMAVKRILFAAHKAGFRMVEFDCDAERYENLPEFEW